MKLVRSRGGFGGFGVVGNRFTNRFADPSGPMCVQSVAGMEIRKLEEIREIREIRGKLEGN